jgi:hypothetical protein
MHEKLLKCAGTLQWKFEGQQLPSFNSVTFPFNLQAQN